MISLVVFLLAGVGAYVIAGSVRGQDTRYCGHDCVPGLKITTVVEALKRQGYTCADGRILWSCGLKVGEVRFTADLFRANSVAKFYEYIDKVELRILNPGGDTLAGADLDYMSWFATLPHRDDPSTVKKVNDWLTEQLGVDGDVTYILDWEYVLQRDAKTVDLTIRRRNRQ
ncbi:hypothetical protein [Nonomuraea cavernae]|uniref:hypothetical protein n=1 Tax=Nonomuraea cavernae TaxID=2045107 RepID=UPI0033DC0CA9